MADISYKTSTGLSSAKRYDKSGDVTTFPFLIPWDSVLCSAELRETSDGPLWCYHTLANELTQLIEYAKQGVRVDEGDTPENYLKSSV